MKKQGSKRLSTFPKMPHQGFKPRQSDSRLKKITKLQIRRLNQIFVIASHWNVLFPESHGVYDSDTFVSEPVVLTDGKGQARKSHNLRTSHHGQNPWQWLQKTNASPPVCVWWHKMGCAPVWTQTQHHTRVFHAAWRPQDTRNNWLCEHRDVLAQIQSAASSKQVEQERT